MAWAVVAVRWIVGLAFVVFGLNFFLKFIPLPAPGTEEAKTYLGLLVASGYLTVVKVLEIAGGALLLAGRCVPLGVVILTPVAVNILLYDALLLKQPLALGAVLTGLLAFLVYAYRGTFLPALAARAKIGA